MSIDFTTKACEAAKKAYDLDEKKEYREAHRFYCEVCIL